MKTHRSIRTWLTLAAAVAVLGGGLLAATTDAVVSEGNEVQSGTFAGQPPGTGVDIQATVVDSPESCNDSIPSDAFSDGPLPAVVSGTFDLNSASASVVSSVVCIRNVGDTPGVMIADYKTFTLTEVGPCEQAEIDAGDTTCADGQEGELVALWGSEVSSCEMFDVYKIRVPAGGYCDYQYTAVPGYLNPADGMPTSDPTAAQTDSFAFDLQWVIEQDSPAVTCDDAGSEDGTNPQPILMSTTVSAAACDDDLYELAGDQYSPGAQLDADLSFIHAEADFDLFVYDSAGVVLGSSETIADGESVSFTAPTDGTPVYIAVVYFQGPGPLANYDLLVSPTPAA